GSGGYTSPIQYTCQPNFVILVTDGLATGTNPWDESAALYTQDHSSSLPGMQNIIVHTVGFGIAVSNPDTVLLANDVLQKTATAGGGNFYDTSSRKELETALQTALQQIVAATFAFATPTIPSTQATGSSKAYLAAFQSNPSRPFWNGYLKAYQRDSNGNVPVDPVTGLPTNPPVWEAGQVLTTKAAADRNIYTQVGSSRVDFKTSTTAITAAMLGVATDTDRANLIDFIRGVDTYDWDLNGNTTEDRPWKLGDIFHSTPVLVTPPLAPSTDSGPGSYTEFKTNNASRTTILLAGANDGMLHAFRDDTGEELWGFIPPDLLSSLKLLTDIGQHPFFVDGNPIVADVQVSGAWKTIVIFGERRGGRYYHALDITDTTNPQYLWSFTDTKMGETWSNPVIGKILMADGSTKFVAFVGGGYDTAQNNNTGKAVFGIDLSTGSKLWEYYHATGATDDSQYMNFSIPADVTAAAVNNNNGYIDRLYVGDIGGQVWKFD
ncbi:MAG TPA: PilC/PilY family type IV pilus protein, partial [Candidatus Methylomirabilis sp.]|nr:PilC/PilY family type IV pilus protein [Candidatus Methylomirabilis sp.]